MRSKLKVKDKLTEWLIFLSDPNNKYMEEIMEKEPTIKKAITVLEFISQSNYERMLYEDRQRALIGYNSDLYGAREEGKIEGIKDIALKMLKDGFPIEQISKITGLNEQQITDLKKDLAANC
jgi:predicted transposase/invertase (TIGR01784 family)